MRSPLADSRREALLEAMLPDVAFDGWTRAAVRGAARRLGMPAGEALALFPGGAGDLVAGFSRWADRRMLDRLEALPLDALRIPERVALAVGVRLEIVEPCREAVRRALAVLALPQHAPLALRLTYETVDAIWYAAGDNATDFSFYTKRLILAGIYWRHHAVLARRSLRGLCRHSRLYRRADSPMSPDWAACRRDVDTLAKHLPNPFRLLRPLR